MGRHSKFNDALAAKITHLYAKGKTDEQVAKIIGVSVRALRYWKVKHPDFLQAIKESKGIADDLVEASLFSRAIGYTHPEEKVFMYKGEIVTHRSFKHYPPDPVAAIYWLNNRRPDEWSNKSYIAQMTPPPADPNAEKKSFTKFCEDAGYPSPYPMQEEMRDFGLGGDDDARMILGSRGYGKTDYVVILGIAYDLYLNGTEPRYLIITKSKDRNAAMLREIQAAAEKNGVTFEKSNATCLRVVGSIGKDHSVSAATIGSVTLRGRHPTMTIMDDPVTPDDSSDATRQHVKRVYDELNKLCKKILIIGQPVHKFDLYADLRPLLRKMEVPHGSIPELDHDLEAQRLAGVDEASIQASYFLTVPAEGATPFDAIRFIDKFPDAQSAVAFIDPSSEGGDYTAISIITAYMQGVAVVGFSWKKSWNHCLDDIAPLLRKYKVAKLAFETNALGSQPLDILRKVFPGVGVIGRRSNNNKHSRIMAAGTFAHMIHLSKESGQTYKDHVIKYEYKAKYDDAPDSLATCLEWIGLIKGKE